MRELHEALKDVNVSELYGPRPGFYSVQRDQHETVPRRVRQSYFDLLEYRGEPVDFSAIPSLRSMIEDEAMRVHDHRYGYPVELILAYAHLDNAGNPNLSRRDREMHFDISGQRAYEYGNGKQGEPESFRQRYMSLFRKANGL